MIDASCFWEQAERGTTAHAVATGAYLKEWDRDLSEGQSWPDVIEGTP